MCSVSSSKGWDRKIFKPRNLRAAQVTEQGPTSKDQKAKMVEDGQF